MKLSESQRHQLHACLNRDSLPPLDHDLIQDGRGRLLPPLHPATGLKKPHFSLRKAVES